MRPIKPTDPGAVNTDLEHFAVALSGCLRLVPRLPTVAGCCTEVDVCRNLNEGKRRVGSSPAKKRIQKKESIPLASR